MVPEDTSERIPLPKGEGAAKRRVRGAEKRLFTPHPVLRTTLSLRERDSRKHTSDPENGFLLASKHGSSLKSVRTSRSIPMYMSTRIALLFFCVLSALVIFN